MSTYIKQWSLESSTEPATSNFSSFFVNGKVKGDHLEGVRAKNFLPLRQLVKQLVKLNLVMAGNFGNIKMMVGRKRCWVV